ncbi:MAG: hypothetical protein ACI4HI_03940 [Lachnospiraceae bacterium]
MKKDFLKCGLAGWCMEILFTSFGNLLHHDRKLTGRTSLWMFPIYAAAALFKPLYPLIQNKPALLRGFFYSIAIFAGEYISGSFLRRHNLCPWDYSGAPTNVNGLIRLDYTPFWMGAGLIFEKILQ